MANKDYVLQIKIKNGPMLRAMRAAGFDTASSLARATGIDNQCIGQFLNLKRQPLRRNGEWLPMIIRIADALKCLPEDLFPPQHLEAALKRNHAEIDISSNEIRELIGWESDGIDHRLPDAALIEGEKMKALTESLHTLPPRVHRILAMRFGLDGKEPMTFDQIGAVFDVSRERVCQIEMRGLKALRKRADTLREAGWAS